MFLLQDKYLSDIEELFCQVDEKRKVSDEDCELNSVVLVSSFIDLILLLIAYYNYCTSPPLLYSAFLFFLLTDGSTVYSPTFTSTSSARLSEHFVNRVFRSAAEITFIIFTIIFITHSSVTNTVEPVKVLTVMMMLTVCCVSDRNVRFPTSCVERSALS